MMKNDRGMTLVEVLAALAILGIVFIGLMTVFPQMTLFTAKTESKLVAMNLAKQELASLNEVSDLEEKTIYTCPDDVTEKDVKCYKDEMQNDTDYVVLVNFYGEKAVDGKENGDTLYRITIKIEKNNRVVSETFGFIKE